MPDAGHATRSAQEALERIAGEMRYLPARVPRPALLEALGEALDAVKACSPASGDEAQDPTAAAAALNELAARLAATGDYDATRAAGQVRALASSLASALGTGRPHLFGTGRSITPHPSRRAFSASLGSPALRRLDEQGRPSSPRLTSRRPFALRFLDATPLDEEDTERASAGTDTDDEPTEERAGEVAETPDSEARSLTPLAHELCEEMARLCHLRRLPGHDPWSPALGAFEQRMLDALDALFALGVPALPDGPALDVLDVLARFAGPTSRDPARTFVRTLALGCIEGEEAVRALALGLRHAAVVVHDTSVMALALAPNPSLDGALRRLAVDGDARLALVALRAMRRRQRVCFECAVELSTHPHAALRREAALCLGLAAEADAARDVLRQTMHDELDEGVVAAGVESLLLLDAADALDHARRLLTLELEAPASLAADARARLLELLALAGGPGDLRLVLQVTLRATSVAPSVAVPRAAGEPTPAAAAREIAALGWLGHQDAIEPLLALIDAEASIGTGVTAANSTQRFLSARPVETLSEAAARALGRIIGADDDEPPPLGARADYVRPDPAALRGRAVELAGRLPPAARLRGGLAYRTDASLAELERAGTPNDVRRTCALELSIASGITPPLCVDAWVAGQLATIERLRAALEAQQRLPHEGRPHVTGEWLSRRMGRRRRR